MEGEEVVRGVARVGAPGGWEVVVVVAGADLRLVERRTAPPAPTTSPPAKRLAFTTYDIVCRSSSECGTMMAGEEEDETVHFFFFLRAFTFQGPTESNETNTSSNSSEVTLKRKSHHRRTEHAVQIYLIAS